MKQLIIRNTRLYFRDRTTVLFSMMSVLITIGLYTFFLKETMLNGDLRALSEGENILDLWLLAGLLSIIAITAPLASFQVMVADRYDHIMKDFYASSMKRFKLVLSYIIAACIIGFIMSVFTLLVGNLYLVLNGGEIVAIETWIRLLGAMILNVSAGSAMMFFLASFLKSASAFTNASVIIGTLNGFLMGIYIPIGALPVFAQSMVKAFPMSYGTLLNRSLLVDDVLDKAMVGAPTSTLEAVKEQLGIVFQINGNLISMFGCIVILLGCILLFYTLSLLFFKRKKK